MIKKRYFFLPWASDIQFRILSRFRSAFTLSSHISCCLPALLVPKAVYFHEKRFRYSIFFHSDYMTNQGKRFLFISLIISDIPGYSICFDRSLFIYVKHNRKSWSSTVGPIGLAKSVLKFELTNTKGRYLNDFILF